MFQFKLNITMVHRAEKLFAIARAADGDLVAAAQMHQGVWRNITPGKHAGAATHWKTLDEFFDDAAIAAIDSRKLRANASRLRGVEFVLEAATIGYDTDRIENLLALQDAHPDANPDDIAAWRKLVSAETVNNSIAAAHA